MKYKAGLTQSGCIANCAPPLQHKLQHICIMSTWPKPSEIEMLG